ncbi:MinD/ParA family protein [Thioalkalivibrio sp. ALMg13-2]|uniref:MinD/ParA family protein n=1 Tax=Thioalkalivibrio sp. ALMg13-2 TaxID=1158167 RepID=UPI000372FDA6|nr:MinD/ParA family protein [Thioalkalivibrio sp. ALMg13-2]
MSRHSALTDTRSRVAARPRVLVVASGKGGVGKSSIAVNLGITLARRGRRVGILDGDTGLANVNILLGLRPQQGLAEVLAGECGIRDILLEGPHGLKIIPGASGIREYAELSGAHQQRLAEELANIEADFDDLLLDTAAGIGDTTLDFLAAGHQVLLVLTPEPTSLTDAFSLLKLALRRQALDVRVIVNMVADVAEARSVFQRFANAVEKYLHTRVEFLGFVQRDESLRSAVTLQHPVALFAENDPSARPFQRLANALEDSLPHEDAPAFSLFWRRRLQQDDPAAHTPLGDARPQAPALAAEPPSVDHASEASEASDGLGSEEGVLGRLRAAFDAALEVSEPEALAVELDAMHEQYRARTGRAAIDLVALVDALQADPEAHAGLLGRLRARLAPAMDAPQDVAAPATMQAGEGRRPGADRPPPDFGWKGRDESTARPARAGSASRVPATAYDAARFGPQEALLERLRQGGDDAPTLAEFLRRM